VEIRISYGGNMLLGDVGGDRQCLDFRGDITIWNRQKDLQPFTGGGIC